MFQACLERLLLDELAAVQVRHQNKRSTQAFKQRHTNYCDYMNPFFFHRVVSHLDDLRGDSFTAIISIQYGKTGENKLTFKYYDLKKVTLD